MNYKDFNNIIQSICDARNHCIQDYDRKLFADSRLSVEKYTQLFTTFSEQLGDSLLKKASHTQFYNNPHLLGCFFSACYSGENRAEFYKKHFTS